MSPDTRLAMRTFSRLLYVVDKDIDQRGLQTALELAATHQAELLVLDVIPPVKLRALTDLDASDGETVAESISAARSKAVTQALSLLPGGESAKTQIAIGRRYLEVVYEVLRNPYDLVIKVAEEPAWLGRFVSSDDMHLLRKCPCPVWLIQEKTPAPQKVVLAAVDFDPDLPPPAEADLNRRILHLASTLAAFEGAQLHVLHVWDSPVAGYVSLWADLPEQTERNILDGEYAVRRDMMTGCDLELKRMLGDEIYAYVAPRTKLIHGTPEEQIPAYAEKTKADVVVMGTVGRAGIPGLIIGNTAEDVLQQLRCSIIAIKPDGFSSPITLA